jgi:hypothetical protein
MKTKRDHIIILLVMFVLLIFVAIYKNRIDGLGQWDDTYGNKAGQHENAAPAGGNNTYRLTSNEAKESN